MKKIVMLIAILLVCLFVFTGCTITIAPSQPNDLDDRFFVVEKNYDWSIYVDRETNVMYLFRNGGYQGGITVMLGADGKPLLYEGSSQ